MKAEPREPLVWRKNAHILRPKLRPIEQTLIVLMLDPGEWYMIDRQRARVTGYTAMAMALRRRGCEVRTLTEGPMKEYFARWTHPVPTEVYEFEVPFE